MSALTESKSRGTMDLKRG